MFCIKPPQTQSRFMQKQIFDRKLLQPFAINLHSVKIQSVLHTKFERIFSHTLLCTCSENSVSSSIEIVPQQLCDPSSSHSQCKFILRGIKPIINSLKVTRTASF